MEDYEGADELVQCLLMAWMLAEERGSPRIDVQDVLGGLYVASLEKLARFWPDWGSIERLAARECGVVEPRWRYWVRAWGALRQRGSNPVWEPQSEDVANLWNKAREIAGFRLAAKQGKKPGILPEDLLFAIASDQRLSLSSTLLASGLDLGQLGEAVRQGRQ